jgi:hypothetical protein
MKALIAILIILVVGLGGWKLWEYWDNVSLQREASQRSGNNPNLVPEQLQGLPFQLEPTLREASKEGASGLKNWLEKYKKSPLVKDPRLAWIELDYVVLVSREDPLEAKRVFNEVKKRTPLDSPVYPRIKSLEKNYE